MDITTIGKIYDTVYKIFQGDARPIALDGVLPIRWTDLELLLQRTGCIDLSDNLDPACTMEKMLSIITLYYSMRPFIKFTQKRF